MWQTAVPQAVVWLRWVLGGLIIGKHVTAAGASFHPWLLLRDLTCVSS